MWIIFTFISSLTWRSLSFLELKIFLSLVEVILLFLLIMYYTGKGLPEILISLIFLALFSFVLCAGIMSEFGYLDHQLLLLLLIFCKYLITHGCQFMFTWISLLLMSTAMQPGFSLHLIMIFSNFEWKSFPHYIFSVAVA